jgi:choline dehydrogenase-like flavoprotein
MKYDLIVVGTGFASSFFLKKYLEKSPANKKVLVIERGRLYTHTDRVLNAGGQPPSFLDQIETYDQSVNNTTPEKPWVFDLNFGGSSNCWWGCTPRFMPNDFALKSLYGQGMDWPITYNDLEKYYCDVEDIMGISGPDITPFPKSRKYPLPHHALSTIDKKMQQAHGGDLWVSQPTARASRPFGKRNACCSSDTCNVCPADAKFTIENGLSEIYQDPRVELKYGLQVFKIDWQNDVAKGVVCTETNHKDANRTQVFEGEIIALGTNAIFNPHILLNSGDTNAFTGKGLSEQRAFTVIAHVDTDNVGGSSAVTANGYMYYDGAFRKDSASCLIENHNDPTIRNERGKWRKLLSFKFVLESLPSMENTVKASNDPFKPLLHYADRGDYIANGKKRVEKDLAKLLAPFSVEELFIDKDFYTYEAHVLGSARMGKDASDSVVDKHQIHHQYRNLFVLGGSSFPTIAAANPTLTISALSLMAADASF